jgi:hypothetical protein
VQALPGSRSQAGNTAILAGSESDCLPCSSKHAIQQQHPQRHLSDLSASPPSYAEDYAGDYVDENAEPAFVIVRSAVELRNALQNRTTHIEIRSHIDLSASQLDFPGFTETIRVCFCAS